MEELEKNEDLVPKEVTEEITPPESPESAENVENAATEEPQEAPKTYTEEEFNAKLNEVLGKKLARREAKVRREYQKRYGDLEDVLRAGTGKETIEDMTSSFREYYESKGVKIPEKAKYSARDIEVLAKAEADEIISSGMDDVVEEVERLAKIGTENMTARDKAVFRSLAEYRQNAEKGQALARLGVPEKVYTSLEFAAFAAKFNPDTPVTEVYELYNMKSKPKKEVRTMGSMKNTASSDNGVKDFYTRDEALKFTKKDFDDNPALFEAVTKSMRKWK